MADARRDLTLPRTEDRYFSLRDPHIAAVAHRVGSHPGIPDNSLGALKRAADLGFRYAEIDLRATTNGQLVLWHGSGLSRLQTGRALDIRDLAHTASTNGLEPVNLETAIQTLPNDMCFFLDLKDSISASLIGETARKLGVAHRLCIGSFSGSRTEAAVEKVEEATGVSPAQTVTPKQFIGLGLEAYLGVPLWPHSGLSAQIPAWAATQRLIESAHKRNAVVIVWTVNTREVMERMLDRGADGIMSDDLPLLKLVLQERGLWAW